MTDKFDPNATPVCNKLRMWIIGSPNTKALLYAKDAAKLEKRARIAEEKLRIAVEVLKDIESSNTKQGETALDALEEIKRIGK